MTFLAILNSAHYLVFLTNVAYLSEGGGIFQKSLNEVETLFDLLLKQ